MKRIITTILLFLLCFIIWATYGAALENIVGNKKINDFISKGVLMEELSTKYNKIYRVQSDFPLDEVTYTKLGSTYYPGGPGDILLTKIAITPIFVNQVSFYIGGHAGISAYDYSDDEKTFNKNDVIEITGFGNNIQVATGSKSGWMTPTYYEVFAVRVNTSKENRFKAFNRAISFWTESYNYSFIFNLGNHKYCSDLVSRAYEEIGIDLNYDGVATTIHDILINPNVYMTYYTKVENNVRYTYYLEY